MKRMTRRLLGIVASSAVALPMAAQVRADEMNVEPHSHSATYQHEHEMGDGSMSPPHAHEHESHPHSELHGHSATVYGSLRYGATMTDDGVSGSSTGWEIGANYGSRFGIKGSVDAGAGLTAGFQIERGIGDDLGKRFHNVSLSGAFGTITAGRHASGYYGATTWDNAAHLGGVTDVPDKIDGVSFASALGGPFDFKVFAGDDAKKEGADHVEVSGTLATGPVSFGGGYMEQYDGSERIGGTVSGSAANITLKVGYESASDVTCKAGTEDSVVLDVREPSPYTRLAPGMDKESCDEDRYGFGLSYLVGEGPGGGNAFLQYGQLDSADKYAEERDLDYWTLGYSYYASKAVTVNLVHRVKEEYNETSKSRLTDNTSGLVLKVDF